MAQTPTEPLELRDFPGAGDPTALLPPRTRESAPFFDALAEGHLILQRCLGCERLRHPIAPVCPYCTATAFEWHHCTGAGTVHSWVRYRRGYLPEFEPLMPYDVLCVSLDEGPRVFGRLLHGEGDGAPEIGMAVQALVERFAGGDCVLAFRGR